MITDFNLPPGVSLADICGREPTRMTSGGDDDEPAMPFNESAYAPVFDQMRAWRAQCVAEAKANGTL